MLRSQLGLFVSALFIFWQTPSWASCDILSEPYLFVSTSEKVLELCINGMPAKSFAISIGRGGVAKSREGDLKTPLGIYQLEAPRVSATFHKFIGLNYPTQMQRSKGFTGSAVGIHGPHKFFSWLGSVNTWFNWTQGCISVGTNGEIDALSYAILDNKIKRVVIR